MSIVWAAIWSIAFGFVTAAMVATAFRLLTRELPSFAMLGQGDLRALMAVPLLAITGPAVLARNSLRGRIIEQREWRWLAGAAVLVCGWSFVTGVFVLNAVLSVMQGLA